MKLKWYQRLAFHIAKRAMVVGASPLNNPESWLIQMMLGGAPISPIHLDEQSALRVTTVFSCIRFKSETVGSLPLHIFQSNPDGSNQKAVNHYLYSLLHDQPNDFMTSATFRETMQGHIEGWGNSYARIEYNGAGRVQALWPLPPYAVKPETPSPGVLRYKVTTVGGQTQFMDPVEILHIPGLGFDGVKGYSPIGMMRRAAGLAYGNEEYAAKFYENHARPGVVLEHPQTLSGDAYNRLKANWTDESGVQNAWKTRILEEGMKISVPSISQADQQFIEQRKFQVIEICRMFRVPPHFVFDLERATFSNIEHQSLEFVIFNLRPQLVKQEQEYNRKLLGVGSNYFVQYNVDGLLRGDFQTRMEGYSRAVLAGWLTRDQVRALENLGPLDPKERGNETMIPVNVRFARDPMPTPQAGGGGDGVPAIGPNGKEKKPAPMPGA